MKNLPNFEEFLNESESGIRTGDGISDSLWSLFNYADLYDIRVTHGGMNNYEPDEKLDKELESLLKKFKAADEKQAKLAEQIFKKAGIL